MEEPIKDVGEALIIIKDVLNQADESRPVVIRTSDGSQYVIMSKNYSTKQSVS